MHSQQPLFERHLVEPLRARFELARSLYLFGARQVGKTTLLRQTFPSLPYISLEDPDQESRATEDPKGFLGAFQQSGAILDELQRVPDLFRYLQGFIDQFGTKFILSGSQNFLMNQHISQSLSGRISIFELMPLSLRERCHQPRGSTLFGSVHRPELDMMQALHQGGYPAPVSQPEVIDFWYADYERTYLERDVRLLVNVTNLQKFSQFLRMVAHRAGSLLNIANLANELGLSESACRKWITILEASGVIFRLSPYYRNFDKRLVKSPKLYFNDTGLLCYLLGIQEAQTLQYHASSGHIFENYVVAEVRKHFLNLGKQAKLFFWQDKSGHEVDLLIEQGTELLAVEIKKGQTISSGWVEGLNKWCRWSKVAPDQCRVVYGGDQPQQTHGISVIPWFFL